MARNLSTPAPDAGASDASAHTPSGAYSTPSMNSLGFYPPPSGIRPPAHSLFSLTPSTLSASTSHLFSLPPMSQAPIIDLTSPTISTSPQMAGMSAERGSPNTPDSPSFTTPPAAHTQTSVAPTGPSASRLLTMQQRQLVVTPSPFKTPASTVDVFNLVTTPSPISPVPPPSNGSTSGSNVARILVYEEDVERTETSKRAAPDPTSSLPLPPAKRPTPLLPAPFTLDPPALPSLLSTPRAPPQSPPTAPHSPSHTLQPLFSPPSLPPLLTTHARGEPMAIDNPEIAVLATASPSQNSPIRSSPTTSIAQIGLITQNTLVPATNDFSFAVPVVPERFRLGSRQSPEKDATSVRLSNPAYSSYNAALAAQAMLEESGEDDVAGGELRDRYAMEDGKLASLLEELVENLGASARDLQEMSMFMQLANNEVLLMNANLTVDDRLKDFEDSMMEVASAQ